VIMNIFNQQYEKVKEARGVLFDFFESIPVADYTKEVVHFGMGSIRNTQAHIINCYLHWIANFALQRALPYLQSEKVSSIDQMKIEFKNIDQYMDEFIKTYGDDVNSPIIHVLDKKGEVSSTPLILFTHVITHEFHHKGQMVSMGRILGNPPPDTDLLRV